MKIAMIGPKLIPSREGGIDVVVEKLASILSEKGHDVTIFVRRRKKQVIQKEYNGCKIIDVFSINKKSTDALVSSFFAMIKGLLGNYDILHVHALGNSFFLWLRFLNRKKRIVVTVHGLDWKRSKFNGLGTAILKKAERRIVKYADEVITLCKNDYEYFRDEYGLETHVIPNGFELYPYTEAHIITEKYGLERDSYILFLARIVPEKGLHYLIDAYKQIDIPQKLVIAGGASHSEEYYSEMKQKAEKNEKIIFTGFVQGQELEELFSNAYLYVLPSDIEGMPMSLLEALGHGCVCLVSDIRENDIDRANSYYFKKGDVYSLKEMLVSISKKRKAYTRTQSLMDWDSVVNETIEVYKGVMNGKKA